MVGLSAIVRSDSTELPVFVTAIWYSNDWFAVAYRGRWRLISTDGLWIRRVSREITTRQKRRENSWYTSDVSVFRPRTAQITAPV
jgi:hypothetical protein